jgi:hypothetical protein
MDAVASGEKKQTPNAQRPTPNLEWLRLFDAAPVLLMRCLNAVGSTREEEKYVGK